MTSSSNNIARSLDGPAHAQPSSSRPAGDRSLADIVRRNALRFPDTGDVGLVDDEGLLHLIDRKKYVIISGGENVYSLEVEDAVLALPTGKIDKKELRARHAARTEVRT